MIVTGALLTLVLAAPAVRAAQKAKDRAPPAVDPYTGGEAEALAGLGYRSFGPFRFGATTNELVQQRLGDVPILWVETEHFRLGSTLEEYRSEAPEELAELVEELRELRTRLARVPAKPKKLDPWLRLHLFARRLERLHADLRARLGVHDGPAADGAPALPAGEKHTVLLTQKKSTLGRFAREFCDQGSDTAFVHVFTEPHSFFFGIADESVALTDSDLHYALVHGVTQNLLFGINGFPHVLPSWWTTGVATWFARAAEPRILIFSRPGGEMLPPDELADWEPLVRGRVAVGAYLGWREMLDRPDWLGQPFGDNVVLWSRIDFLLRGGASAPELVRALHAPEPTVPDGAAALQLATGHDLAALDAAWCAWVTKTYRKKRR